MGQGVRHDLVIVGGSAERPGERLDDWFRVVSSSRRVDAAQGTSGSLHPETLLLRITGGLTPDAGCIDSLYDAWRSDRTRPVAARVLPFDDGAHSCLLGTASVLETGGEPVEVPTAVVYAHVRVDAEGDPVSIAEPPVPDERRTSQPAPHPATQRSTSIGEVVARAGAVLTEPAPREPGCFLTVLTRTQGRRPQCLAETLLCLAGQTVRDFEVVLVRHRATPEDRATVDDVVAGQPSWLRERIRVVDLETGNRSAPLNLGFEQARGRYVAVLDDDDLVLSHWVESFRTLEQEHPAQLLRAGALRLPVLPDRSSGTLVAAPTGPLERPWPTDFSLLDHLLLNRTPCMSVAFPRGVFTDLGVRFDETLDTTEDWDFLLQAAAAVGVACTTEFTSIYRWWEDEESSRQEHPEDEWDDNHDVVQGRLDDQVILLPRGSVTRLRALANTDRVAELEDRIAERDLQIVAMQTEFGVEIGKVHDSRKAYMASLEQERARVESKNEKLKQLRSRLQEQAEASAAQVAALEAEIEELKAARGGSWVRRRD